MMKRLREKGNTTEVVRSSDFVFGPFWFIVFASALLVAGPWAGFHGGLLGALGLLILLRPPAVALPRLWWVLAGIFLVSACAVFLPAAWFGSPAWRGKLESLGVETGSMVVIQSRQAAEALGLFAITLFVGLWLAGHRPSSGQLRLWSLAFTVGVAAYAVLSRIIVDVPHAGQAAGHFGFFPNRNHTATYLAMGTICGLGCVLQALRDRRFSAMAAALVATAICLWAVAGWSVSRAGVVLVVLGVAGWLAFLGPRYLGKNGVRTLALIGLACVGLFFIADSGVKQRLATTAEKTGAVLAPVADPTATGEKSEISSSHDLDFRIPIALDTLDLIRDFKWTGIGAGQFFYVFPQYRNLTAVANDSDSFHPESDWLWMASETGLPATLALAALVIAAAAKSARDIRAGRDRALRTACLAASLIVPVHGIFDVPGHRITLALAAAFLFALSLRADSAHSVGKPPPVFLFRMVSIALMVASAFLIRAEWLAGPQPARSIASHSLSEARRLYDRDRVTPTADAHPNGAEDLLESGLELLAEAEQSAPLDRGLRRYQGFLALFFEDMLPLARKANGIERALDPTWVGAPLDQAFSWSNTDLEETSLLWDEALRRARWLDLQRPGHPSFEAHVLARILAQASANPALEQLRKQRLGE